MKHFTFIFTMLFMFFACCAVFAEDAHFTCDSDPADFNGKTFENLYLDLEGCGEEQRFEELTVTGNLVYNGGKDAVDHKITFNKPAIQNMWVPCEPTHNVNITFIPSDDVEYVVSEMTVMPTGEEKGKIVLNGTGTRTLTSTFDNYSNDFYKTEIDRLNFVTNQITDDVAKGFRMNSVPAGEFEYADVKGKVELEINDINVMEMSVVNTNPFVLPAVTSETQYKIYLLAAFSPSLKLYSYNKDGYRSLVFAMLSAVDGSEFTYWIRRSVT